MTIQLNPCLPSATVALDAKNAGVRVTFGFKAVLAVLGWCRFTQIAKSVVGLDAVDVVNKMSGPVAVNDGPCNSVRVHCPPINFDAPFPALIRSGALAGSGLVVSSYFPRKFTRTRVVIQQLAEFFNWNFVHAMSFISGRIAEALRKGGDESPVRPLRLSAASSIIGGPSWAC